MRRYSLITGTMYAIAAELEDHAVGREHLGRPGDGQPYRDALKAVLEGTDEVAVGHVVYRLSNQIQFVPTVTSHVTEGTLEEVVDELDAQRMDRMAQGRVDRAQEYAEAIAALLNGSPSVKVRQIHYQVAA